MLGNSINIFVKLSDSKSDKEDPSITQNLYPIELLTRRRCKRSCFRCDLDCEDDDCGLKKESPAFISSGMASASRHRTPRPTVPPRYTSRIWLPRRRVGACGIGPTGSAVATDEASPPPSLASLLGTPPPPPDEEEGVREEPTHLATLQNGFSTPFRTGEVLPHDPRLFRSVLHFFAADPCNAVTASFVA